MSQNAGEIGSENSSIDINIFIKHLTQFLPEEKLKGTEDISGFEVKYKTLHEKFLPLFSCRYQWAIGYGNEYGVVDEWRRQRGQISGRDMLINWFEPSTYISVNFDTFTRYLVLDIDNHTGDESNPYLWPANRVKIEEALEGLGINTINWYTSSANGGLHGYIVFSQPVLSFWAAVTIKKALSEAGIEFKDGLLELRPNAKAYNSSFQTHRLPCQQGFECSIARFLEDWDDAARENDASLFESHFEEAQRWLRKQRRKNINQGEYGNASKLYQDLLDVLQNGWTGKGESNFILGRIAYFHRVFSEEATSVEKLADLIEETALNCPGFYQYSNHQVDLRKRSMEWAKCAWEKKTPFGNNPTKKRIRKKAEEDNQKIQSTKATRFKIAQAVLTLSKGVSKVSQRAVAQLAGISQTLVSRHKDLLNVELADSFLIDVNNSNQTVDRKDKVIQVISYVASLISSKKSKLVHLQLANFLLISGNNSNHYQKRVFTSQCRADPFTLAA